MTDLKFSDLVEATSQARTFVKDVMSKISAKNENDKRSRLAKIIVGIFVIMIISSIFTAQIDQVESHPIQNLKAL